MNIILLKFGLKPMPQSRHRFTILILLQTDEDPHGQMQLTTNLFHLQLELLLFLDLALESVLIGNDDQCISFLGQFLQTTGNGFCPPNPIICIPGPFVLSIN